MQSYELLIIAFIQGLGVAISAYADTFSYGLNLAHLISQSFSYTHHFLFSHNNKTFFLHLLIGIVIFNKFSLSL